MKDLAASIARIVLGVIAAVTLLATVGWAWVLVEIFG